MPLFLDAHAAKDVGQRVRFHGSQGLRTGQILRQALACGSRGSAKHKLGESFPIYCAGAGTLGYVAVEVRCGTWSAIMKALNLITLILVIVGGINWGLIAVTDLDLVANIFGADTGMANVVYGVVGLSAL
jgi:uncharacterized protein